VATLTEIKAEVCCHLPCRELNRPVAKASFITGSVARSSLRDGREVPKDGDFPIEPSVYYYTLRKIRQRKNISTSQTERKRLNLTNCEFTEKQNNSKKTITLPGKITFRKVTLQIKSKKSKTTYSAGVIT
jgi:hypothetical protein